MRGIMRGVSNLVLERDAEHIVRIPTIHRFEHVQLGSYSYGEGNFYGIQFQDNVGFQFGLPTVRLLSRRFIGSAVLIGVKGSTSAGPFHEQYILYMNQNFLLASRTNVLRKEWEPLDTRVKGAFPKQTIAYLQGIVAAAKESEFLPPKVR